MIITDTYIKYPCFHSSNDPIRKIFKYRLPDEKLKKIKIQKL